MPGRLRSMGSQESDTTERPTLYWILEFLKRRCSESRILSRTLCLPVKLYQRELGGEHTYPGHRPVSSGGWVCCLSKVTAASGGFFWLRRRGSCFHVGERENYAVPSGTGRLTFLSEFINQVLFCPFCPLLQRHCSPR